MIQNILRVVFGSKFERDLKKLIPIVRQINSLEESMKGMDDSALSSQTKKFKERIVQGESLDSILPEAFATVREVSLRTMGMRHFDVQMMGGIALHGGNISEMKTGEGKTLTSTLAVYLNSLAGNGVHVVTVNDYLAKRDANWMKPIYDFLGISVGVIQHDMDYEQRKFAYAADITYGTNNEFGFDYLRDNMVSHKDHKVQRSHFFAIVDEVDSILIDEARTPLIISGPSDEATDKYVRVNKIIPKLFEGDDFEVDEKARNVLLTEKGVSHVEEILSIENLYAPENVDLVHHVHQALKAHKIFRVDKDYVVQQGQVVIIDEFTGRPMEGRRYSDGLHQAIEAKENVTIAKESQTLASITFQNYFRMYDKLAGMTGTADTEAEEFKKIYNLDVIVIPPNVSVQRKDSPDRVYRTENEKFQAILTEIRELQSKKQPVLVGTISIEKSEVLSKMLASAGIQHNVLNAKFHQKEAEIVANAGKPGAVTIATNMAGRGTDIVLGGAQLYKENLETWKDEDEIVKQFKESILRQNLEYAESLMQKMDSGAKQKRASEILSSVKIWKKNHEEVLAAGGLHILGTERHEARRIDNQLRGRSGRQGDPGSSRFYLSLQDDLMRIFGSDRISGLMKWANMPEGQEIESKMVSNAIARAQKRVEGHNFDIRKHLLEYDDVMNRQRIVIYKMRNEVLENEDISDLISGFIEETVENQIVTYCEGNNPSAWNLESLKEWSDGLDLNLQIDEVEFKKSKNPQLSLFEKVSSTAKLKYESKAEKIGKDIWKLLERNIFLDILDHRWKEHLYSMDHLREGIWTVGYSERNPLVEYKLQGFRMFDTAIENLKNEIVNFIFRVEVSENSKLPEEKKEYKKVGQEITGGFQEFSGGNLNRSQPNGSSVTVTTSSGGGTERKTSRRRKR
ncbi:preprotein translocase subunit SecA [Leptospira kirschneri]|uniref:Protein translocase subunit SecA n=1 Tax=Leptospira kirschneri str. 200802841 TaxID=1193047 RepID=A0A828Y530_9LEPT|nr:preprotein translocase subunit SecA [Leptospira kirschneri]EMO77983.1 preprotein translocase, SecA subunit [Leptospira kirschneri str. 200801925]EKO52966.1 preprotein translocase, SecA subunit [Leptospira kirschneri str. 200802841]EMN25442.1 preprotein translocase, SecA subunit [Leptospira kirschneri serovar Sokoine str. RM1]EMO82472.1 preprotein translocase, SecA subunit [Leptospira kirschneri str. 200801774]EPG51243.1 preprotein translocase, SecA subunit [Leptospira kirschneri serovar Cyn